ncbi:hypothetical protein CP97_14687 [Aurantiacibacter atlanticus]|uniref:Uncharacterized protein n=1 Tax=Aurantiacibacter atlanticus TaxID=1648404 RepID=A0A161IR57_9SPHN|nr:hypothetical protein CP97_14687 [Aurantiacibacter atlanticus]
MDYGPMLFAAGNWCLIDTGTLPSIPSGSAGQVALRAK